MVKRDGGGFRICEGVEIFSKIVYSVGMPKIEIISRSDSETQKIAKMLGRSLTQKSARRHKAVVIALEGELGSGKTTFSQGLAKALGVKEKVLSPTFVLIKIYPIREKCRMSLSKKVNSYERKILQKLQPMFLSNRGYPIKKIKRFTPHLLSAGKFSRKAQPTKGAGFKHLIHIDCYRLKSSKDLLRLGFRNFLKDRDAIITVEWASLVKNILPKNTIWIRFKHGSNPSVRILHI